MERLWGSLTPRLRGLRLRRSATTAPAPANCSPRLQRHISVQTESAEMGSQSLRLDMVRSLSVPPMHVVLCNMAICMCQGTSTSAAPQLLLQTARLPSSVTALCRFQHCFALCDLQSFLRLLPNQLGARNWLTSTFTDCSLPPCFVLLSDTVAAFAFTRSHCFSAASHVHQKQSHSRNISSQRTQFHSLDDIQRLHSTETNHVRLPQKPDHARR